MAQEFGPEDAQAIADAAAAFFAPKTTEPAAASPSLNGTVLAQLSQLFTEKGVTFAYTDQPDQETDAQLSPDELTTRQLAKRVYDELYAYARPGERDQHPKAEVIDRPLETNGKGPFLVLSPYQREHLDSGEILDTSFTIIYDLSDKTCILTLAETLATPPAEPVRRGIPTVDKTITQLTLFPSGIYNGCVFQNGSKTPFGPSTSNQDHTFARQAIQRISTRLGKVRQAA